MRGMLVQTHQQQNSVTEAVRHRLRRDRVSTPYYVGKTSKQSLGPGTVLESQGTMTLQQLCFLPSGLGELVDAVGANLRMMTLQQLCFLPSGLGELVDAVGESAHTLLT